VVGPFRSVVLWGVSCPDPAAEVASANVWKVLAVLFCGSSAITSVSVDEGAGLVLASNAHGVCYLWGIPSEGDSGRNGGESNDPIVLIHGGLNMIQQFRIDNEECVASCLVVGPAGTCVFGCHSGAVFVAVDWTSSITLSVPSVTRVGSFGAVSELCKRFPFDRLAHAIVLVTLEIFGVCRGVVTQFPTKVFSVYSNPNIHSF